MAAFKICLLFFMVGMIITDAKSNKKFKGRKQVGDGKALFPKYDTAYEQEPLLRQNVSYYLNFNEDNPTEAQSAYVALSYPFLKVAQYVIQNNADLDDVYDKNAVIYADLATVFTSATRDYVVNVFDDVVQKHQFARYLIKKYCVIGVVCNAEIEFIKVFLNQNQKRSLDLLLKVGLDLVKSYNDIYPKLDESLSQKLPVGKNVQKYSSTYKKHILVLIDVLKLANSIKLLGKDSVSDAITLNVYE